MMSFADFQRNEPVRRQAINSFPNSLSEEGLYNSWFFIQDAPAFMRAVLATADSMADPSSHLQNIRNILNQNFVPDQIQTRAIAFPEIGERFLLSLYPEWGQWWTENVIPRYPELWMKQTMYIYDSLQTQQQKDEYRGITQSNFNKYADPATTQSVPQELAAKWTLTFFPDSPDIAQAAATVKMGENQKLIGWLMLGLIGWYGAKTLMKKR